MRPGFGRQMSRRRLGELAREYARTPAERLRGALDQRLAVDSRCPVARYLLACWCFDRGQPATAVRHMMVAHHAEPQLQSAALLVFAGLNWVTRRNTPLLPVLLETWEEFRRPEFDCLPRERALLDAFAAAPEPGLAQLPPLATRLWRLPIVTLRAQIREAVLSRDAGLYPLLAATA
ncbi:MAG: hypothetical protein AB1716_15870 [Planctomycetota bacterium]